MVTLSSNFIKFFDILGSKPELKINGNSRYITNIGILMGLISVFFTLILSISYILDVFSRTKFSIIYNFVNRIQPNVKLNKNQISLLLIDALGREIIDYDRVFNFNVKFWKIQVPKNTTATSTNSTNVTNFIPVNTIIDLPLRNCSDVNYTFYNNFYVLFSKIYKSGLCVDFSSFNDTLFGEYGSTYGYSTLNIYINKCVNNTRINKTNCLPIEVIDKKLAQTYMNLVSIENDVDSENFTNPIMSYTKNELLPISSTIFKNYFKDLNSVTFDSDDGMLLDNLNTYESYRTDKISESVDLRGSNTLFPGTFSQIIFRCSGKTEIYSRTYIKFPETFAKIGGILQAFVIFGKVFVLIWSKNNMLSYLILHIFENKEINLVVNNRNIQNDFKLKSIEESKQKFVNTILTKINKFKKISETNSEKQLNLKNKNTMKIIRNNMINTSNIKLNNSYNKYIINNCEVIHKNLKFKGDESIKKDIIKNKEEKFIENEKNLNYFDDSKVNNNNLNENNSHLNKLDNQ